MLLGLRQKEDEPLYNFIMRLSMKSKAFRMPLLSSDTSLYDGPEALSVLFVVGGKTIDNCP